MKRFLSAVFYIITGILITFVSLIGFASRWAFTTWGDIDMDEIVFHLQNPLEGTGNGMIGDFLLKAALPTVLILAAYIVLIILFAYFYTSITFNPLEVANNMKKSGGFIPGIRPGRPTSDYLTRVLNYIIFLGATGLTIVAVIPIIISGLFNIGSLSFTGTSLIIIVGVILETLKAIESSMLVRNYKGFLSD